MRENNLEIKDYIQKSHLNTKVGKKLNSKYKKVIDIKKVKNMMLTKNKNNQESHFLFTLINISLFIKKFEFSKY